ncbi:MAG: sel1 repeat family protein [Hormoscilla sp. GUM202]|nr:sel1 repeat family protein [Hormoscilla sp. GUM202]
MVSAQKNIPFAQSALGDIFSKNNKTSAEAITWYKAAAVQNFPWACYRLGEIYAKGQGVPKNDAEAVKWYRKAAQDYRPSQEILGNAYKEGLLGLPQDEELARYWLVERANLVL